MAGAARISDKHVCPKTGHSINTIVDGEDTVLINGLPAATVGSTTACGATIITGSSTVTINGKPAAVIGSATSHGGVILSSSGDVFFGDNCSYSEMKDSAINVANDYTHRIALTNDYGVPLSNMPYRLEMSDGKVLEGMTDADGYTDVVNSNNKSVDINIFVGS